MTDLPTPLTAWYCDTCDGLIEDPQQGLLTWRGSGLDEPVSGFLIVHKNLDGRACDPGAQRGYLGSSELVHYLGLDGQQVLLAFLSAGPMKSPMGGARVASVDEFVDVFRRLQTPWYEEARRHWQDEETQYWLGDANEVYCYLPETLERVARGTLGG